MRQNVYANNGIPAVNAIFACLEKKIVADLHILNFACLSCAKLRSLITNKMHTLKFLTYFILHFITPRMNKEINSSAT